MDKISQPLRLLLVEDNPSDAELLLRELRRAGFEPDWQRVDTEAAFSQSLNPKIDVIVSDYAMPQFSGLRALELANERGLGIPFILVSGTIGEETAVSAMRSGAADYLLKDRLARLGEAIRHALEQRRLRDERKRVDAALDRLQRQSELILNCAAEGIYGLDLDGNINFINPKGAELLGWPAAGLLGKPAHATIHHSKSDGSKYPIESCSVHADMRAPTTQRVTNDVFWRKDGTSFRVDYVSAPLKDEDGRARGCIVTFKDITEQFVAEARQKLQAEQYRLLFETNPNAMWVFDTNTLQILAVNQVAIRQYGYSHEEFLKLTLKDLRPFEDVPDPGVAGASAQSPARFSGEFRHRKKDGSGILVEIFSSPIVWHGTSARMATAVDVTERKRAEEGLRRQAAIIANANDAVVVRNYTDDAITFWNKGAERLYGWTQDEVLGKCVHLFLSTRFPKPLEEIREIFLREGHWEGELRHTRRDAGEIVVLSRWTLERDQDGAPVGFIEINTDITERKRAEERLREQADIIDRAHDAVIACDFATDQITVWNNGAERLYGWSASEAIGKPMGDLIFSEPNNRETMLEQLVATGEFHGEIKHRAKDGREVIVDARVTLVRDENGLPRSSLAINADITEKRKLEMQLLRVQRLESIGTLASGVAHDLNNVLAPILMCSDVLRRSPDSEDAQAAVSMIEQSARRGASIVKQVLTFARGVEGERVLIQPSHLIEELVDIARRTFPKSIEIRSRYPKDLWPITADPTQLHQVLLNLSVNARDAMPDGGSIVISAENRDVDEQGAAVQSGAKTGPYLMLRVSDSGTGMPREVIDQIFDPFFTTKEIGKGTGLGLSTALGIVKSHGGLISVRSEIGKGTTFEILLPATPRNEDLRDPAGATARLQGNGQLILVVDDEPSILGVTKLILESCNYGVIRANDGQEALAAFSKQKDNISAVLTDMMLPHMSGLALIRELKRVKPDAIVIASSGHDDDLNTPELEALGVTDVLVKPYDTQALLATVRHALS